MKYVTTKQARDILGVHANTLRKWANAGKIKHYRTESGQRRYDVASYLGEGKDRTDYCYCRVSSPKQKDDLARQIAFLKSLYPNHEIIKDVGSGLNFKRKGLTTLLERACEGTVGEVVVAHKDRLARFGFEMVVWIIKRHGGTVVVLDNSKESPQQELTTDLLTILHVFSCRLHGLRKYRDQIKKDTLLPQPDTTADA